MVGLVALRGLGLLPFFETAVTWWASNAKIKRIAKIEGGEHLRTALARGRGVIIVGGHFTNIEIATRILGTAVPLNVLYRAPKNQLLGHVMYSTSRRYGKPFTHDDIRSMPRGSLLAHNERRHEENGRGMLCQTKRLDTQI